MSNYRCVSDCRSRGHKFDPGPVPYFVEIDYYEIISMVILPLIHSRRVVVTQLQAKVYMCMKYWLPLIQTCPGEKVWLGELTVST